jgi:hypothetical protein
VSAPAAPGPAGPAPLVALAGHGRQVDTATTPQGLAAAAAVKGR